MAKIISSVLSAQEERLFVVGEQEALTDEIAAMNLPSPEHIKWLRDQTADAVPERENIIWLDVDKCLAFIADELACKVDHDEILAAVRILIDDLAKQKAYLREASHYVEERRREVMATLAAKRKLVSELPS